MRHKSGAGVVDMAERDNETIMFVTERFERRLAEETGKLRVEMANGFGSLRAEMIDRNAELLKWGLIFGAVQTSALGALITLLR